jgi:hypothetical protein
MFFRESQSAILAAVHRARIAFTYQVKWGRRMKARMTHLLSVTLFAIGAALSTTATATTSTNYSDLWGTGSESGWGLNISQQADTLFGTFFVYGAGDQPIWYSATFTFQSSGADGTVTYSGDLYQTTGPAIDIPWNPALVRYRLVGLATLEFGDDAHALLRYTVDNLVVVKQVTRLTFAPQTLVGSYIGSTSDITFNCTNPARNNLVTTDPGPFTITQEGGQLVIHFPTCEYTGPYEQQGQIGRVKGTYFCTNLATGAVTFTGMQAAKGGIVGNYTGFDNSCSFRGNIGGMRQLQ